MVDIVAKVTTLLDKKTATVTGDSHSMTFDKVPMVSETIRNRVFQAFGTTTSGNVTATVVVQGSLDDTNWVDLGTITLSGASGNTDGFASDAPWPFIRGDLTALSGTGAAISLLMGV